jgi:hypothetical protein
MELLIARGQKKQKRRERKKKVGSPLRLGFFHLSVRPLLPFFFFFFFPFQGLFLGRSPRGAETSELLGMSEIAHRPDGKVQESRFSHPKPRAALQVSIETRVRDANAVDLPGELGAGPGCGDKLPDLGKPHPATRDSSFKERSAKNSTSGSFTETSNHRSEATWTTTQGAEFDLGMGTEPSFSPHYRLQSVPQTAELAVENLQVIGREFHWKDGTRVAK